MSLPRAVEEANRRAEELHRQVYGNTEQPAPENEEQKAEAPAQQEPPKAAEAPSQEPAPVASNPAEEESFKRKYEVLRGKYEAEIPRMAAEIRSLKEQLAQAASKAAPAPAPSKLKPEEVEEYGEKFIDVVKRAAAEVVPEDVGEIKQTVEQLKSETVRLARDRFFSDLSRMSPQWERLNEDKDFLTWLAGIDPLSGQSRQDLFDQASASFDAWRVANFFNSYGSENKPEQAVSQPDLLAQQVEPPTTRVSVPPPAKKIWSIPEINRFYADLRTGKIDRDNAARIEADIFAAQSEGRIR